MSQKWIEAKKPGVIEKNLWMGNKNESRGRGVLVNPFYLIGAGNA